jgi:drug/metabolite transporter (DMT)-like permease
MRAARKRHGVALVSARAWAIFAALAVLWGIPYLFIKVAVDGGMPPGTLAWGRVVLGALVLSPWALRAGTLRALRSHWRWLAAYAIAEIAIPFPLIAAGEQHLPSSLAAIIIAAVPLIIALLALRFDRAERVNGRQMVGLVIGMFGVVALVGVDVAGRLSTLLGAGAILLAAVGYSAGPMILKKHLYDLEPRAAMSASLAIAALALTPVALLDLPSRLPSASAFGGVAILGLLCTATAFSLMAVLVVDVGAGRASVTTYLNPVIAVALGVVVLGEQPGASAIAGLLLILAGSWISTDGRLPPGITRAAARLRPGLGDQRPAVSHRLEVADGG